MKFELRQEVYEGDPYAGVAMEVFPTFHGYARSGTAAGPVVYANYGRVEDFRTLKEMGVEVKGNYFWDLEIRHGISVHMILSIFRNDRREIGKPELILRAISRAFA